MTGVTLEERVIPAPRVELLPLDSSELGQVERERALLRLADCSPDDALAIRNVIRRRRVLQHCDDWLRVLIASGYTDRLAVAVGLCEGFPPVLLAARLHHAADWSWHRIDLALRAAGVDFQTRRRASSQ